MDSSVFDSRDLRCKAPYGAVPCGTEITLTVFPLAAEGFQSCALVLFHEFADLRAEIPLRPAGPEGDRFLFTGTFQAPAEPELIWYRFRFLRPNGEEVWLDKNGFGWQQTVYDSSLPVPDWFGRGVTYQIFPDRFCREAAAGAPDAAGLVGERAVHLDWAEPVELPEDQGGNLGRDFFGGTLAGIGEKLNYLKGLGVTTLYLCPVFEAASNHRYNTADYERIDPMLGTEEDCRRLCAGAHALGRRVMLDGVFNHTGSNSRYFNAEGFYPALGAAQSRESSYYPWYTFSSWPDRYDAWWGISTLPAVNESCPSYLDFIVDGENSVIRRWLRLGADAWRLDVADELPDDFIARIRSVMAEEKPDSVLLGEVWEDGSNKISYDQRRKYLLGRETHGLMNYTFRTAALAYLLGMDQEGRPYSGENFQDAMESIRENYPPFAFYSGMNFLGTHDTPRILTLLGRRRDWPATARERLASRLTPEERDLGCRLLRLGALLLFAFPGSPTIFYGDEAGMEGYEDPLNRGTFPWGREDRELQHYYARLGIFRSSRTSLQRGSLRWLRARGPVLAFARSWEEETTLAVLNAGERPVELALDWFGGPVSDALTGRTFRPSGGELLLPLRPLEGMLLV